MIPGYYKDDTPYKPVIIEDPDEDCNEGSQSSDYYTYSEEDEMVKCADDYEDDGTDSEGNYYHGVRNWKVRDVPRPLADTSVPGYQTIACFMAGSGDKCPVCHQQRNTQRHTVLPQRYGLCGPKDIAATGVGITKGNNIQTYGLVPARPKIVEINPPPSKTNADKKVVRRRRRKTKEAVASAANELSKLVKAIKPEGSKQAPMELQE